MLQGKETWCSEVLYYGEFYLLCIWGEGHKRVTGEGHHKGRERSASCHESWGLARQRRESAGGPQATPSDWTGTVGTQRRITEGVLLAALHNLQDLSPTQGLQPEPQQWRPRIQNPGCQPRGPQGIPLQRVLWRRRSGMDGWTVPGNPPVQPCSSHPSWCQTQTRESPYDKPGKTFSFSKSMS